MKNAPLAYDIVLMTGPASEPVQIGEFKHWARIDGSDEDALLQSILVGARQTVENYTRRSFVAQTWKMTINAPCARNILDYLGDGHYELPVSVLSADLPRTIQLPRAPVISITSVVTYSLDNTPATYPTGNYVLVGDRLALNDVALWPSPLRAIGSVEITFVSGYTQTPAAIKNAIMSIAHQMYESRALCEMSDADMPKQAKTWLAPYRVMHHRL